MDQAAHGRPTLAWDRVSFGYGSHLVIHDLTIGVRSGEVLALAGRSGCGKSSLLNMATGLAVPDSGRVANGFARTACVFQEPRLLPWRRAGENIAFGLKALGLSRAWRKEAARRLGERVGLAPCDLAKYPHQLSGGMRQRVSLARAIAVEPDLLLLDEPFNALDVGLRREMQELVLELIGEKGLAAVFVTHDLTEAARMSNRLAIMAPAPGRIVYRRELMCDFSGRGPEYVRRIVADLLADPAVAAAFGTPGNGALRPGQTKKVSAKEMEMVELRPVNLPETRLATDMAGRKVSVKARVNKLFGYNPMVTALIFCLAPEKIAGLGMPPMPPERVLADEAYLSLPVLGVMGGIFGGGKSTFDKQAVQASGADLILSMTLSAIDEIEVRQADALQAELNLPVLIYDGRLDRCGEVLRRVGALVDAAERGIELADYFEEKFSHIQKTLAKIPAGERRTVYYAQSPTGLLSEPRGARHGEIIDFAGGVNAAEVFEQRGCGKTPVSADDLLRWDPDLIIVISEEGKSPQRLIKRMATDPFWSRLKAVQTNSCYEPPAAMYHWFDRPPSVNRLIGLIWLTHLLYPDWFNWDMVQETIDFYGLFYRIKIGPKQAEMLLGASLRPGRK